MKKLLLGFAMFGLFVSNCKAQAKVQFFTIEDSRMTFQEDGGNVVEVPKTHSISDVNFLPTGNVNINITNAAPLSILYEYTDAKGKIYRNFYKKPTLNFSIRIFVQDGEKYRFTPYTESKCITENSK